MYVLNIFLLIILALVMFISPVPLIHENMHDTAAYQALRFLGLIPLILAIGIGYLWLVIRFVFFIDPFVYDFNVKIIFHPNGRGG